MTYEDSIKETVTLLNSIPPAGERRKIEVIENILAKVPIENRTAYMDGVIAALSTQGPGWQSALLEASKNLRWDQRERVVEAVIGGSTPKTAVIRALEPVFSEHLSNLNHKVNTLKGDLEELKRITAARTEIDRIAAAPVLQKLGESGFYKCLEALHSNSCLLLCMKSNSILQIEVAKYEKSSSTCFVVQHDWAAAFERATEFNAGEYRLPYDSVIFEFRISGSRVCLSVDTKESVPTLCGLYIETPVGWGLASIAKFEHGVWKSQADMDGSGPILELCTRQMRAIAISLEAEVAVTEVVRAPYKLNAKRERAGKLPLLDYHVINLAHRTRPAPLPQHLERGTHASPRLHFRRGHWRHYEGHETWINWMLVGNPDLGFIDKHYKL